MITLYGRNPVLELLQQDDVEVHKVHLASTNKDDGAVARIKQLAKSRNIELCFHTRQELSRISKNSRQDQGVAIDLVAPGYQSLKELPEKAIKAGAELILLDRVTNPQNIGMIIRSVAASPLHGMIIPRLGSAKIDPLVFKASAGNLLKANIYHCHDSLSAIEELASRKFKIVGLDTKGDTALSSLTSKSPRVWVLGNESEGLSSEVLRACDYLVSIPLENQVESLNVSAAATLVAFRGVI